jgi:hypothetical protein
MKDSFDEKEVDEQEDNPEEYSDISSQTSSKKWLFILIPTLILIVGLIIFLVISFSSKTISEEEFSQGTTFELKEDKEIKFILNGEEHIIVMDLINSDSVSLIIQSKPIQINIKIGEEKKIDLDDDGIYDLKIKLKNINKRIPELYIKKIQENICIENWDCEEWSSCSEQESKTRTCNDLNSCGTEKSKPISTQSCIYVEICTEDWECSEWNLCISEGQSRICNDLNSCGITENKPDEQQECEADIETDIVNCGTIVTYIEDFENIEITNTESVYGCVISAAENCELVEYEVHSTAVLFGVQTNSVDHFEIKGMESGKCVYYLVHEDVSLIFTEETINSYLEQGQTQEQIDQMEHDMQNLLLQIIGNDGICLFDPPDLVDTFNLWANGQVNSGVHCEIFGDNICIPTGDLEVAECSGNYWGGSLEVDCFGPYNFHTGVTMEINDMYIGPLEILEGEVVIFEVGGVTGEIGYLEIININGANIKNLGVEGQMVSFEVNCEYD